MKLSHLTTSLKMLSFYTFAYLPSTQARFRTNNNRTVEATYRSDTKALKETQN